MVKSSNTRIKIIYKKLGRQRVYGQVDGYPIEVDERLKGVKKLEIITHECLHYLFPHLSEEEIIAKSIKLAKTLWYEKLRFIDDDNSLHLQDGTKLKNHEKNH